MPEIKIAGHPSVGEIIMNLFNTGKSHDIRLAAKLYVLIQRLNLDPTGKDSPDLSVYPVRELSRRRYHMIFHKVLAAKIIPFDKTDISTQFRIIFITDADVKCNIYLMLGYHVWDYPGWKEKVQKRYLEFQFSLKKNYINGETPIWRTP